MKLSQVDESLEDLDYVDLEKIQEEAYLWHEINEARGLKKYLYTQLEQLNDLLKK